MWSPLQGLEDSAATMYPQEDMDWGDLPEDLQGLPADLEKEIPESRDVSFLFNGNDHSDDNQDFCEGAEFDYSLPANGDGSSSPQLITAADVPGWLERHPVHLSENMNLFDCVDEDFKGDFWLDESVVKDNAKWASDDTFSFENEIETIPGDYSPPLTPVPAVEANNFVNISEVINEDGQKVEASSISEDSVMNECQGDDSGFEEDRMSPMSLPDDTPVLLQPHSFYPETPASVYHDEAGIVQSEEDSPYTNAGSFDPPIITLDDDPPPLQYASDVANTPRIIKIPISAVFKKKSLPVVHCTWQPKRQVIKPQVSQDEPRIIYLKKVSVSKPVVKPEPVLKDIISGDGDELLRELLPTFKSEPLKMQDYREDTKPSTSQQPTSAYGSSWERDEDCKPLAQSWDQDEDYQPSAQSWEQDEDYQPSAQSRRRRPFTKEEKKLRKKEQNKRAALRYREKKRGEFSSLAEELNDLDVKIAEKTGNLNKLELEADLLKSLVKDLIKKRIDEFRESHVH